MCCFQVAVDIERLVADEQQLIGQIQTELTSLKETVANQGQVILNL